jgi:uncharacterized membrane protein
MNVNILFLFLTIFLASTVEVVEMAAIVLGVGLTRGWRAAIGGVVAALLVLSGVVASLGPALMLVPISALRATIGILLLLFGSQWLRKGILRINLYGLKSPPAADQDDEETTLQNGPGRFDWTAFVVSFKGVLLEGLEIVFIVVSFGTATHLMGLAALSAFAACTVIVALAFLIHKKIRDIPRHLVKYSVGLLLVTFGTYWAVEGLGVEWPGEDLAILGLLGLYFLFSILCLYLMRISARNPVANNSNGHTGARQGYLKKFGLFWYQFLIGDDWIGAVITVCGFIGTYFLANARLIALWLLPVLLMLSLSQSLVRHTVRREEVRIDRGHPPRCKVS